MVDVKQAGRYRFTLRQWPKVAGKPVIAVRAGIEISGQKQEGPVTSSCESVVIELDLPAGPSELMTYLYDEPGKAGGAYFTEVEWLGSSDELNKPASTPQSIGHVSESERTPAVPIAAVQPTFDFKAKGQRSWKTDTLCDPLLGICFWLEGYGGLMLADHMGEKGGLR